jgi:hypothetical protein
MFYFRAVQSSSLQTLRGLKKLKENNNFKVEESSEIAVRSSPMSAIDRYFADQSRRAKEHKNASTSILKKKPSLPFVLASDKRKLVQQSSRSNGPRSGGRGKKRKASDDDEDISQSDDDYLEGEGDGMGFS